MDLPLCEENTIKIKQINIDMIKIITILWKVQANFRSPVNISDYLKKKKKAQ